MICIFLKLSTIVDPYIVVDILFIKKKKTFVCLFKSM